MIVAVAIPVALLIFVQPIFESPEGEEPWGELFFSIFFGFATVISTLTFGTLALVLASPESEGGKATRRVGLGILGVVCLLTGVSSLANGVTIEGGWVFFAPMAAFTLPTGLLAIFAFARDMTISEPRGGWPKALGLIPLGILSLFALPLLIDLGARALLIVVGPLLAFGALYILFGDKAPPGDHKGQT
jgi:hypothetical protein